MAIVSIVTPVYNASGHLTSLYHNLCEQSLTDWEWVVVDDGSTDGSGKILDDIQSCDTRVKVFHQSNSGSAKMPRDRAVYESTADFVIPIDADDSINAEYLQIIVERQAETKADIVYPTMLFVRDNNTELTLPKAEIDTMSVYSGRDALLFTIPEWQIGCNGGMYKKKVWVNSSYPSGDKRVIYMNSDEVDERLYLLEAEKVAFCDAQYRYILHPASISNSIKLNRFDILDTNLQLLSIIKDVYGCPSEAYEKAQRKVFYGFRSCTRLYMEHYEDFADSRKIIVEKLHNTFCHLTDLKMTRKERLQFLGMHSFRIVLLMASVKYRGLKRLFL